MDAGIFRSICAKVQGFALRPRWVIGARGPVGLLAVWLGVFVFCPVFGAESESSITEGQVIGERFRELTRSTEWRRTGEVKLQFRTYHPQGMALVGDRFFLSSVEVIDRAADDGVGHLFEVDFAGNLRRQIQMGEGSVYHPGGIDFDGRSVWVPVAEYRPDSRSLVYRVDPVTLSAERVFQFADHLGALVCDRAGRQLLGVSWGSRRIYRWDLLPDRDVPRDPNTPVEARNHSFYVDYQDGQFLPRTSLALFSGLGRINSPGGPGFTLGGLELVDLGSLRAVHQVPVPLWTARGQSLLQNPMAAQVAPGGLRFLFVPEDDSSVLYSYTVE